MIKKNFSIYHNNSAIVASCFYNLRNRKVPKATNKEVRIYILHNRTITKIIPEHVVPVCLKLKEFRCINLTDNLIQAIARNETSDNKHVHISTNTIGIESNASNKIEESKDCI